MRMVNEYGSAFKTVHTRDEMEELISSGWRVVEEPVPAPVVEQTPPVPAPKIVKGGRNQLMYKNKYLSQWVSIATKKELKEIFDHYGIAYAHNISKNDMVVRLRQYIREVKAEQRREKNDGN